MDAKNGVDAGKKALSDVQVGAGRAAATGSGMRSDDEGGKGEKTGGATMIAPLIPPAYLNPRPSGPTIESAGPPCKFNCGPQNEYIENPAMDLPEKPIEAPAPVAD